MIAVYKINGYDISLALRIKVSRDKVTANSFDQPNGILQAESYQWAEGINEIDLDSPVILKPREFIIKGMMILENQADYIATKLLLRTFLHQNYVTLEATHLGEKANARLKEDGISWTRINHLESGRIGVEVQFSFDELMQTAPFKDFASYSFDVNTQMDLLSTTADNSIYKFSLNNRGNLILTT